MGNCNRIVLFASVVLAGAALAATSSNAAPAADECTAKPNGVAPAGKHWYYRTNREIKRKCWYLGDEGEKTVAVAPSKKPAAAAPVDQDEDSGVQQSTQPTTQSSTANARAELIEGPKVEQPVATAPQPQMTQPQTTESLPAASDGTNAGNWTMASRWPDASNTFSADPATTAIAPPAPAPAPQTENRSPVIPDAVIAAAAVEPADQPTVGVSNTGNYGFVFAGAILAVIAGGAMFMFFSRANRVHVSGEESMTRHGWLGGDEMSPALTRSGGAVSLPSQSSLRDEIEELLEASRQARAH